jgi:hypothetical protein
MKVTSAEAEFLRWSSKKRKQITFTGRDSLQHHYFGSPVQAQCGMGLAAPLVVLPFMTLPLALPVLGSHKTLGMLLKLVANFGVRCQVLIETRMRCPELRVVYQLWILR